MYTASSTSSRPDQQIVLAEHPAAHPAEERAELDTGQLATDTGRDAVHGDLRRPLLDQWREQMLERRDVGPYPRRPIDDADRRWTRQRTQPGGGFDLIFQPGDHMCNGDRRRSAVIGVAPGDARGNLLSAAPVDRRLSGCHGAARLLFAVSLRGILRGGDLLQVAADQTNDREDRHMRAGGVRARSGR